MTEYDTVSFEIEVPLEHSKLYQQVAELVQQNLQMMVDKNQSYGDIRSSAQLLERLGVYPSATEAFAHRGFSRLTEKHSRYAQLQFTNHETRVPDEDKVDTCLDAANYWIWQAWMHEYGGIAESPINNTPWINGGDGPHWGLEDEMRKYNEEKEGDGVNTCVRCGNELNSMGKCPDGLDCDS